MSLRWVVLALVLANVLFFAWSRGWLGPVLGYSPSGERDPARHSLQVQPEIVRVLSPEAAQAALAAAASAAALVPPPMAASAPASAASGIAAAASVPPVAVCLETGPLAAPALDGAERALAGLLPERGWIRVSRETPAQYGVVVGPLVGRDAMAKKQDELAKLRVSGEELRLPGAPEGQFSLVLGRFETNAAAQSALEGFTKRGVRTARVATLRAADTEWRLRLDNLPADKAGQLRAANLPALGPGGLAACAAVATR